MTDISAPVAMPNRQNVALVLEVWVCIFFFYNLYAWSLWVTIARLQYIFQWQIRESRAAAAGNRPDVEIGTASPRFTPEL